MLFNTLAAFAEFEADLIGMRTGEGIAVARAGGELRGKQPKLSSKQARELRRMHETGDYSIADLAEVFTVSWATSTRRSTGHRMEVRTEQTKGCRGCDGSGPTSTVTVRTAGATTCRRTGRPVAARNRKHTARGYRIPDRDIENERSRFAGSCRLRRLHPRREPSIDEPVPQGPDGPKGLGIPSLAREFLKARLICRSPNRLQKL